MDEPKKIKPAHKLFAINYVGKCSGNAYKSAICAGYSENYARGNAHKLLVRDDIQQYIHWLKTKDGAVEREIMELDELQEWWTKVIKDGHCNMRDRLRASELLGKSKGAFDSEW